MLSQLKVELFIKKKFILTRKVQVHQKIGILLSGESPIISIFQLQKEHIVIANIFFQLFD